MHLTETMFHSQVSFMLLIILLQSSHDLYSLFYPMLSTILLYHEMFIVHFLELKQFGLIEPLIKALSYSQHL